MLAIRAVEARKTNEFLQTNAIISAILRAGSLVASVVSGQGDSGGSDGLQKAMKAYKEALFPDLSSETEDKAAKAQEILERELNQGALHVTPLEYEPMGSRRRRRKRGSES